MGCGSQSIVARIVMDQWAARFLVTITDAGLEVHAMMKYVDDVNLVVTALPLGTRWDGVKFYSSQQTIAEDIRLKRSVEHVTMEALRVVADGITTYLRFTCDIPERHPNDRVLMLDIQVWVHHSQDPAVADVLMWSFYEKPTASGTVLRASSAYTWRSKLVTLGMETFRRMRNSSRHLELTSRVDILCKFVLKMRKSGHVQATVEGVLVSGLTMYYRKLRTDLQGGPPLNRRNQGDVISKRRSKLGASESWFSGGEGARRRWRGRLTTGGSLLSQRFKTRGQAPRSRTAPSKIRQDAVRLDAGHPQDQHQQKRVLTNLLEEYTVDLSLKMRVQEVEEAFCKLTGGGRVRVIEKGGMSCPSYWGGMTPGRPHTHVGMRSAKHAVLGPGSGVRRRLPGSKARSCHPNLMTRTSHQCRREGTNYALQCLDWSMAGLKAVYWGESSRSARQRLDEHSQGVEKGLVSCPMVHHSIEAHEGKRPHYTSIITNIEPSPLYIAVREACQIASNKPGLGNINRCQEWGQPQVPVLWVQGGDPDPGDGAQAGGEPCNPRPEWTASVLDRLKQGTLKRIKYYENDNKLVHGSIGEQQPPSKRPRMDPAPPLELDLEVRVATQKPEDKMVRTGGEEKDEPEQPPGG